ncbi:hypothetical protein [Mycoplasma sp. ATU-Cv-508]|uniref:hypothetical protein n=1 Tax=Mycoplasma sp. ATU-Cv-508 TaxID=2048001 RepID=UPI000FDD60C7
MSTNRIREFEFKDLRLWGKNPRYTNIQELNLDNIGYEDYDCERQLDVYNQNLDSYYKKLIKIRPQVIKLLDLTESLSSGFNPDIDEILVSTSPYLRNKDERYKKVFYVLEGNRRLFSLHLIFNLNNARETLRNSIGNEWYAKFERIFNGPVAIDITKIECKVIDIKFNGEERIKKILNSRHFGYRKGKLNWPRGLVLQSIYQRVLKFREEKSILDDQKATKEQMKDLKIDLENFTGKKITNSDLNSSLWTIRVIDTYNYKNPNNKISFEETDEELGKHEEDIEQERGTEGDVLSDQKNVERNRFLGLDAFSISSLELAYTTIKAFDSKGNRKSLSSIIDLKTDTSRWKISHNLSEKEWNQLCIYIVESIRSGKLNTRKFEDAYAIELQSILRDKSTKISQDIIEQTKNKRMRYEDLSLGSIISSKESNIEFKTAEDKDFYNYMKTKVVPQFERISELSKKLEEVLTYLDKLEISDVDKKSLFGLIYTWTVDFQPVVLAKYSVKIRRFPFLTASSLLRSTSELISNWLVFIDKENVTSSFLDWLKNLKDKGRVKGEFNNTKYKHIETAMCKQTIIKHIYDIYCHKCNGNEILRRISYKDTEITKAFEKHFKTKSRTNYWNVEFDLPSFVSWVGSTRRLNTMIHKCHYVYRVVSNPGIETLPDQLNTNLGIVSSFLEMIYDWAKTKLYVVNTLTH